MNTSRSAIDNRSTMQIVMERALLGFVPVNYRVADDERWHTVNWPNNPALTQIEFSDGTVVNVDNGMNGDDNGQEERMDKATRDALEQSMKEPPKVKESEKKSDSANTAPSTKLSSALSDLAAAVDSTKPAEAKG